MTSEKQINANRRNAAKSTGPKSSRGKALTRLNAAKHGLYATLRLLPGEDRVHYRTLAAAIMDYFKPVGPVEETLTDQIIGEARRLKRNGRAEHSLFERFHEGRALRIFHGLTEHELNYLKRRGAEDIKPTPDCIQAETRSSIKFLGDERAGSWPHAGASRISPDAMQCVEAKLEQMQDWDLTLLEAILPAEEREPLARIERQRRTIMHTYLAYVATLKALQHERRLLETRRGGEAVRPTLSDDCGC